MEAQHQGDIVDQFLASEGCGEVTTEKLRIPGVQHRFKFSDNVGDLRPNVVKLPMAKDAKVATRPDLAEALAQALQYRPSKVVGIAWEAGSNSAHITTADKGSVELVGDTDTFKSLFEMVLKSRGNFSSFNWQFDKDFIEVTFQSNPYR